MRPLAPEHVRSLTPYPPGQPVEELRRALGIEGDIVKLASNENSFGPSPMAVEAAARALAEAHRYPDGGGFHLRRALGQRVGVEDERIMLGNGSNEIIELILRTFLAPEETAVVSATTFVVYKIVLAGVGRRFHEVPVGADLACDLERMADVVAADPAAKVAFVATPNNPTGLHVGQAALERFLGRVRDDLVVVVDEAYREYVTADDYPDTVAMQRAHPRIVTLRTFSKAYGLAGLRIGYAIASAEVVDLLERVRQPFNTNSVAQAAALAALEDHAHIERTRRLTGEGARQLAAGLRAAGARPVPTQANFVLADVGRPAGPVFDAMLRGGVMVRAMGGYGLPDHLRITVGTDAENRRCLEVLGRVLAQGA